MRKLIGVTIGSLLLIASMAPASAQTKWRLADQAEFQRRVVALSAPPTLKVPPSSQTFQIIAPEYREDGSMVPLALDSWSFVECKEVSPTHAGYWAALRGCIGIDPGVRQASFRVTFCSFSIGCDASVKGNIGWDGNSHRVLYWANPSPDQALAGTFVSGPCIQCHTGTARSLIWNRTLGAGNFVYGRAWGTNLRWPDNVLEGPFTWDSQLCELTVDC